jgi:integrase
LGSEISKLGTVLKYVAMSMDTVFPDIVGTARPLLEYNNLIGPSQSRDRRPTADELERLSTVLSPAMWDIVQFAVGSAMRRGEIVRIRWTDIDEERKCVLVRDRKHPTKKIGNHMVVPLTSFTGIDAWSIMLRQPRIDERVFPFTTEFVSDSFGAARDALGIEDLHFHDLRHEATSRLFEAGLMIQQVAVVTGHRNWRNLQRYTHVRPETVHALGSRPDSPPRPESPHT